MERVDREKAGPRFGAWAQHYTMMNTKSQPPKQAGTSSPKKKKANPLYQKPPKSAMKNSLCRERERERERARVCV